MNWFGRKITVVTHSGSFHADEVFACATLALWADKQGFRLKITRSRDPEIIKNADMVVDVGMEYDSDKNRFDHHQKGGAGEHANGIPFASFGLVRQRYGEEICGSVEIFETIERKLVIPVDATDNGINIVKNLVEGVAEYRVAKELVYAFGPDFDAFVDFAEDLLKREIRSSRDRLIGESKVEDVILKQNDPEVLIIEEDWPWEKPASKTKNTKLVIYPEPDQSAWCIEGVRTDLNNYSSNRNYFPESWRGLRGVDLEKASGIKGGIFCHRAGFIAVVKTKEGAIEMAKVALQNQADQR